MEVARPMEISFGSGSDRDIYPMFAPTTRFENELKREIGQRNTGPAKYNPEDYTNVWNTMKTKITSLKGYTLGGRTAKRMKSPAFVTPSPTAYESTYQTIDSCLARKGAAARPFNSGKARFARTKKDEENATPAPGAYAHGVRRFRKVQWLQAFGGTPVDLPSVREHRLQGHQNKKTLSQEEKKFHGNLAYLELYFDE